MFDDFFAAMEQIEADTDRKIQELFGDRRDEELTDEETDIIFADMPHETKLAKLAGFRAGRTVKPRSFARHITKAGRVHATALGIKLD
jgi:hypothetical protein